MIGIILAAGRGSRMQKLTNSSPKCFVKFRGKRLIDWQIEALAGAKILDVRLITGYRSTHIEKLGFMTEHNDNWSSTNMVASLLTADNWLLEEEALIVYSDIIFEPDAVRSLVKQPGFSITYDPNFFDIWSERFNDPFKDAETFELNFDGTLKDIGGVLHQDDKVDGQFMGLLKTTPATWLEIREYLSMYSDEFVQKLDMTSLIKTLITNKVISINAVPYYQSWFEFDQPSDLKVADKIIPDEYFSDPEVK